ncbi:MAG: hypothetical protein MUC95_09790 [Spirochaetes bacterium]|nr:hypothetical protein [Spirochaetota bacterium]
MILNLPSKIIVNILMPELEIDLKNNFNTTFFSVSPFMPCEGDLSRSQGYFGYKITTGKKEIIVDIYYDSFRDDQTELFSTCLDNGMYNVQMILSLLCKKNIRVNSVSEKPSLEENRETKKRIDISFSDPSGGDIYIISIIVPDEFFKFILRKKEIIGDTELLEESILDFFINPFNFFPVLKVLLDSLGDLELQKLLYKLQSSNLLTTYQICLLVRSFPEHSLRIKDNISRNRISDVSSMLAKLIGAEKITKRDILEGMYSIEEAIFMLIKSDTDTGFFRIISGIYADLVKFLNLRKILKMDFITLVKDINESGLLNELLSSMNEIDIAKAISDRAVFYYEMFIDIVEEKKIKSIRELVETGNFTYSEKIWGQYQLIRNYRRLKIKRLDPGPEKFKILLTRMTGTKSAMHLLSGVGWYTLATAFKTGRQLNQAEKKKIISMFDDVPAGAKYLILDVLDSTVNPNIIHDEMQINRARTLCVKEIAALYEDGIINIF